MSENEISIDDGKMALGDFLSQSVINYKSHWYESIKAFVVSHGRTEFETKKTFIELVKKWGANLKI